MLKLKEYAIVALVLLLGLVTLQLRCDRAKFRAEKSQWVGQLNEFKVHLDGSAQAARAMVGAYEAMEARLEEIGGDIEKVVKSSGEQLRRIGKIEATLAQVAGEGKAEVTQDYAEYEDPLVWMRYWFQTAMFEYRLAERQLKVDVVETQNNRYVEINDLTAKTKVRVDDANWIEYEPGRSFWSKLNLAGGLMVRDRVDLLGAVVIGKYAVLITKGLVEKEGESGWRLNTDWRSGLGIGLIRLLH